MKVILADFGLGAHVADVGAISKRCGTPGYTAPEMLQKGWGRGTYVKIKYKIKKSKSKIK